MLKNVEMSEKLVVAQEMKNLATEARTLFPEWQSIGVTFLDPVGKWRCHAFSVGACAHYPSVLHLSKCALFPSFHSWHALWPFH